MTRRYATMVTAHQRLWRARSEATVGARRIHRTRSDGEPCADTPSERRRGPANRIGHGDTCRPVEPATVGHPFEPNIDPLYDLNGISVDIRED